MIPVISVVVPAYNSAKWIERAIDSALAQRIDMEIEVIVIDDASTDNTAGIVASRYEGPTVRLIVLTDNGGPARARNRGMRDARGDYIALLDSDDMFAPGRLSCLFALAEDTGAEIVADRFRMVNGDVEREYPSTPWFDSDYTEVSAAEFVKYDLGATKPILRRQLLDRHGLEFSESLRYSEDFDLFLRAILAGGRMLLHRDAMYIRMARADSISRNFEAGASANFGIIRDLLASAPVRQDRKLRKELRKRRRRIKNGVFRTRHEELFAAFLLIRQTVKSILNRILAV
jgi:succinoglycan biosynthesis protein ExoO